MNLKKILPFIGLSILFLIIYRIGINKIILSLTQPKIPYLILALILSFLSIFTLSFKWSLILKKQGIYLNYLYLTKLYFIGLFYGTITPARAGSLIRAYYLKNKIKKQFGECASSIVLERVFDLSVIFILAITGCLLLINYLTTKTLLYVIIAFLVFICLFIFLINKKRTKFIFKFIYTFLTPKKFKTLIKDSYDSFYTNIPKLNSLIIPFLFTFINWILVYLVSYIVAKSLSINVPIYYFIPIYAFSTIIAIIPITIAGLGTRELTLISLFSIFNILPEKVIALSLLSLIISLFPAILGFILSLKVKDKKNELFINNSGSTR